MFVCGLDLSGQRRLLGANPSLLLFVFLEFSREEENSIVTIGLFTFCDFVCPSGVFQLAGRFSQYPSRIVVLFKESVALVSDLGTFFAQGRHSRFAFE